jgi:lipopolysaccharide/colanic/teichoic acid biosynthesis glycosyltransferase
LIFSRRLKTLDSDTDSSQTPVAKDSSFLDEDSFHQMLHLEQKRTERSRKRFVLMLLDCANLLRNDSDTAALDRILCELSRLTRDTDIKGQYAANRIIGVVFTEIGPADGNAVAHALLSRVSTVLSNVFSIEQINQISVAFHVFPEDWGTGTRRLESRAAFRQSVDAHNARGGHGALIVKRIMDIIGSLCALILLAPVFVVIGLLVKLTSPGPVLFRQERVGQGGRPFSFLKFRSMFSTSTAALHQQYVTEFISGNKAAPSQGGEATPVYKLTHDPRVTRLGRFLRKTSLDELPQLFNVLRGDMSLVGPRPPISYEVQCYDVWHIRRLLAVKPGMTGLWQVTARSKVEFDEMVRLDLQYARSWSLWQDLKILLKTPGAVIRGAGAH